MSKLPQAVPCPDKPPLHLRGGYLCVASPLDITEACFSVPAVRALRHFRPHATIAILCPKSQEPVWRSVSQLNHVLVYEDGASVGDIAALLKGFEITFESVVLWEAGNAAKAFARLKTMQRLGYPAPSLKACLTDEVGAPDSPGPVEHRVRYYLNFVRMLGGDAFVTASFERPPLPPPPSRPRIVIVPSSEYGDSYQWPLERFVEVVQLMNDCYADIEWIIHGLKNSEKRQDLHAELAGMLDDGVQNLAGKLNLEKTLNLLASSSAVLACDGALAHLAAHLGVPAAVIFGPNEPEWKRPLGKQSLVVREHVACSPCYQAQCPLDMRCLLKLSADAVFEQLHRALRSRHEGD